MKKNRNINNYKRNVYRKNSFSYEIDNLLKFCLDYDINKTLYDLGIVPPYVLLKRFIDREKKR